MRDTRLTQRFFPLLKALSDLDLIKVGLGVFVFTLLIMLAVSEKPNTKRIATINEALDSVTIDEMLFAGFKEQVEWIAHHAGVEEPIFFDQSIDPNRLDIVISHAGFSDLTKCGRANAIYDPILNVIFIDEYLLWPTDLPFLGWDGPSTMYSEAEFSFWRSGLSFIIAHEFGHYNEGDRAAAFFSIDWLFSESQNVDTELKADAFAVTTLAQAYEDPEMPSSLTKNNALHLFGLGYSELKGMELAAADMIGALKGMVLFMQFMSGPYSPFFVDSAHPSFLDRILGATEKLPISPNSVVSGQLPILTEEVKRLHSAAKSNFVEILTPGPLARVAVTRETAFWGIRDLIHSPGDEGLASLYKTKVSSLFDSNAPYFELLERETGSKTIGDVPDTWLDIRLEEYAPSAEMHEVVVMEEVRLHQPFTKYSPDELQYIGEGWLLETPEQHWIISKMQVKKKAAFFFKDQPIDVGSPFVNDNTLIFPINLIRDNRFVAVEIKPNATQTTKNSFFVLRPRTSIKLPEPEISFDLASAPFNADYILEAGWIDIEGARWNGHSWLLPSRDGGASSPDVWRLFEVSNTGSSRLWAEERLLSDFIQEHGEASFGRDLDPSTVSLIVLNPSAVLIWYENDSVWLVKPKEAKLIFHPAFKHLKVTRVNESHALFWVSNATKAYLVNINVIRN